MTKRVAAFLKLFLLFSLVGMVSLISFSAHAEQTLSEQIESISVCFLCDIFEFLFDSIAVAGYKILADANSLVMKYVVIFSALWIVYRVLKAFWSAQDLDPGFWKDFIHTLAKLFVVTTLIAIPAEKQYSVNNLIYNQIITPIIGFSVEASKVFTDAVNDIPCRYTEKKNVDEFRIFDETLKTTILCQMDRFSLMNGRQLLVGVLIMQDAKSKGVTGTFIPDFHRLFIGLVIIYFVLYILWHMGLKFIDAIFAIGIFSMLLPFLLVAWVFPETSNYFSQGFKKVLESAVTLFTLNFTVSLATGMIDANFFGFEGGRSYFDVLVEQNNKEAILQNLSLVNVGFLEMVALYIILSVVIEKSSDVVKDFLGLGYRSDDSISKAIDDFSTSAVNKLKNGLKLTFTKKTKT